MLRTKEKIGEEIWQSDKAQIALAFQTCVAKTFLKRVNEAIEETGLKKIVLAGGVAANSAIRSLFKETYTKEKGFELVIPSLKYCTDNAVMIASAAYFSRAKASQSLAFDAYARA